MTTESARQARPAEPDASVDATIARIATGRVTALRATIATRRLTPSLSLRPLDGLGSAEGDLAWWSGQPTRSADPAPLDWSLRREIAMRLLSHGAGRDLLGVWTRPGPPEVADCDYEWAAALRYAAAAYGGPAPRCLVVTRWGWLLLPGGASRVWSTPRPTPAR
ncbi:MAG: hypothetical protein ACRDQD_03115 [Nocardioidaceae bacterium]